MIRDHAYTPAEADALDARRGPVGPTGRMPQLPDDDEARAWVLSTCEGRTQAEIADLLKKKQSTVCRMIERATSKIDTLVRLNWISREQLERYIRQAVGLAART